MHPNDLMKIKLHEYDTEMERMAKKAFDDCKNPGFVFRYGRPTVDDMFKEFTLKKLAELELRVEGRFHEE